MDEDILIGTPRKESHYKSVLELMREEGKGHQKMGIGVSWAYYDDPKRLAFLFARYKFAAKMIAGKNSVLEVGCGDGFATRILRQAVNKVTGIDVDDELIEDAISKKSEKWPVNFYLHDMLRQGPMKQKYDACVCLDVLEHIPISGYQLFLDNIRNSLLENAVAIIGCPSIESQKWASIQSKKGHISCMTQDEFKTQLEKHFRNVFLFSMNDEIVHTGFSKMSHYNIGLCVG